MAPPIPNWGYYTETMHKHGWAMQHSNQGICIRHSWAFHQKLVTSLQRNGAQRSRWWLWGTMVVTGLRFLCVCERERLVFDMSEVQYVTTNKKGWLEKVPTILH